MRGGHFPAWAVVLVLPIAAVGPVAELVGIEGGVVSGVSVRHRPQGAYLSPSLRLSSVGSFLWILMRLMRFSIPKSVKAIAPSSPRT